MEEINQKIYDKAVQLLAIRMHSTGELFDKLKRYGFAAEEIRAVLSELESLKFLDDKKYAEIFVENLKRYKDFGYFGIKAKLLKHKIPSDLAALALGEFFSTEDEIQIAKRLVAKLRCLGKSEFEKLARALSNRGFRSEATKTALEHKDNSNA